MPLVLPTYRVVLYPPPNASATLLTANIVNGHSVTTQYPLLTHDPDSKPFSSKNDYHFLAGFYVFLSATAGDLLAESGLSKELARMGAKPKLGKRRQASTSVVACIPRRCIERARPQGFEDLSQDCEHTEVRPMQGAVEFTLHSHHLRSISSPAPQSAHSSPSPFHLTLVD
jgi:hypothetical protein